MSYVEFTCPACPQDVTESQEYCPKCGTKLEWENADFTAPPKSNNPLAKGIAFVLVFGAIFGVGYYFINSTVNSVTKSLSSNSAPTIPLISGGIGTEVADGQFTFKVLGAPKCQETGTSRICRVNLLVSNHSKTAGDFFDSNQKLADGSGNLYTVSSSSSMSGDEFGFTMKTLNPGFSLQGILVFEVPTLVIPTELVVHDSAFSDGAGISLS